MIFNQTNANAGNVTNGKPPHLMTLTELAATIRGCITARANRDNVTESQRLRLWNLAEEIQATEKALAEQEKERDR
jgi:hypothetical protein